jgi:hypothetical protein
MIVKLVLPVAENTQFKNNGEQRLLGPNKEIDGSISLHTATVTV